MPNYQALSAKRHAKLRWTRPTHFHFAAQDAVVTLLESEVAATLLTLPVGFMPRDGRQVPVALMGLAARSNLVVSAEGQWTAGHVPMAYRHAPFELAATGQAGQHTLVCDTDSPLLSEEVGEPLFGEDGQPAAALAALTDSLRVVGAAKARTQALCALLTELALLKPWEIQVQTLSGNQRIEGVFCVDEARLNSLDEAQWARLRQANALPLIYAQLFSMQQVQRLVVLAAGQEAQRRLHKVGAQGLSAGTLPPALSAIDAHGTIQFGRGA